MFPDLTPFNVLKLFKIIFCIDFVHFITLNVAILVVHPYRFLLYIPIELMCWSFLVLVLSTNYVKCKNIPFHILAYYFTQQSSFQELFLFIPFFLEFQSEKFNFSYFNNVVMAIFQVRFLDMTIFFFHENWAPSWVL